jgi:hypothetical protein
MLRWSRIRAACPINESKRNFVVMSDVKIRDLSELSARLENLGVLL